MTFSTQLVAIGANPAWRFNQATGALESTGDNTAPSPVWTPATVGLAVGATPLLTSEGVPLAAALTAQNISAAVAPAPELATSDNDGNGELDGGSITFFANLASPLPGTNGVAVTDDDSVTTASAAVSVDPTDPSKIIVVSPEATLEGFLEPAPAESKALNLNTGSTGATLPYTIGVTSSDIKYASVFNTSDGLAKKIADIAPVSPTVDGAKPVVLSATFLGVQNSVQNEGGTVTSGDLEIVASEALDNPLGPLAADTVLFNSSPLQLINLNAGLPGASLEPTPSETNIADDTATLHDVGADVVGKTLTFSSTSPSGIFDTLNNDIQGGTTPKVVTAGVVANAGPEIMHAAAIRADAGTTNLAGNITSVVVVFDKTIQVGTGQTLQDGMFRLRAELNGNTVDINIPAANVTISGATATLTIPAPGIPGDVSLTDLVVEYNAVGTNTIVSAADADHPAIVDETGPNQFDVSSNSEDRDADTAYVAWQFGGAGLYAMEFRGKLTAGPTPLPANTLVDVWLMTLDTQVQVRDMNVAVPCDCTAGANVAVNTSGLSSLANQIKENTKIGKTTTPFYLIVNMTPNQEKVSSVEATISPPSPSPTQRAYQVSIDHKTGAVTGNGIKGTSVVGSTPVTLTDLCGNNNGDNGSDCGAWAMTKADGTFRVDVSVDQMPTNQAFILASFKRPDQPEFHQFTSAVVNAANFVPFVPNVGGPGALGTLTIDTNNLVETGNDSLGNQLWDTVPFSGIMAMNSASPVKDLDITRLLISTSHMDGSPSAEWLNGGFGDGELDQAFTLVNNVTASSLQIFTPLDPAVTLNNIKQLNGGLGLALFSESADITYLTTGATPAPLAAQAGKWSLVTFTTAVPDLSAYAAGHGVGAVVVAGAAPSASHDDQQFVGTFFAGATDNSLTAVGANQAAFVFFTTGGNFAYGAP
jgi:hypothetical protein